MTVATAARGEERARTGWLLSAPLLLFTAFMFLYPAISVIRTSVAGREEVNAGGFTLSHYTDFFTDELYLKALSNTLLIAVLTVLITGVLGLVYAYQLTMRPGLRQLQLALLLTPLLVNGVVRIFGLQLGLISVNDLLMWANLVDSPLGLNYSFTGIVIALVMFQFPFMAMAVYASLSRLDTTLVEAAQTLGAGRMSVLARVVFPLAVPGLVAGGVLTFAAAAGTFIVPAMMGGGRVNTVPQMIYTSVSQSQLWATASAFAVILVVVLVVPIMVGTHFGNRDTAGVR
ncbi:ABC transporter permease [Phytohabitans sp. ZYX-F-186]|uniref:ABC transporter permease n=1 Tax=Phytohabitans maris TaxID=3071409 RepID=A0ABU0ZC93_9ACTN|nr:ABC transporter permease [Phytohabitans sp. ZYX-F-186]MDQ7903562.1 ABC transporter permease [Phytohabitans sp. ZYX-F-186]